MNWCCRTLSKVAAHIVKSSLCLPAWLPVCPQLMAVGVPVSFLAGAGICWGHLMYAWKAALKFKVLPDGVKPRTIHRFWSEFNVEVASRIGRVWDEEGVLDQTALEIAENVLKVRQQRSRNMRLAASSFCRLCDKQPQPQGSLSDASSAGSPIL